MKEITKTAALLAAASGIVFGVVTPLSASAAEEPLKWTRCAGSGLDPRQQCATLEVPMDYAHPGGRTIDGEAKQRCGAERARHQREDHSFRIRIVQRARLNDDCRPRLTVVARGGDRHDVARLALP